MASKGSSKSSGFGPRKAYLVAYNAASAVAWATVLGRVLGTLYLRGSPVFVPFTVDNFARVTQTFAVCEILHAITGTSLTQHPPFTPRTSKMERYICNANSFFSFFTGIVPAPFFTTAMQVASRLVLMWGISLPFPALNGSAWYSSMLTAWSTTEVIRYTYFALKQFDAVPGALHWLRYSAFLVLYPIGISSEVAMILQALLGPAPALHSSYPFVLMAILLAYVPGEFQTVGSKRGRSWDVSVNQSVFFCLGSVVLYTHMLKQRSKYLGGERKKQ